MLRAGFLSLRASANSGQAPLAGSRQAFLLRTRVFLEQPAFNESQAWADFEPGGWVLIHRRSSQIPADAGLVLPEDWNPFPVSVL